MTRKHAILIGAGALFAVGLFAGGYHLFAPRRTPSGQPALTHLVSGDLGPLREQFNASVDVPRVVAMLSPT